MATFINTALIRAMVAVADLRGRLADERGQDLMEYALLGGLIAVAAAGALVAAGLSGALDNMATGIKNCIDLTTTTCP